MEYSFKELYSIIDGDRGKNYPQNNDFYDEGYCLFLNAGNVTKTGWSFDDVHFITQEKDEKLHNGRLSRGDIVITTRGTVGNVVYYDDSIPFDHVRINSGMVILKNRDEKRLLGAFSYYLLTSPYVQKKISLFCSGSAQPQLPIKDFVKIKVEVPSIDKQQLIVNKVSAYDSLIELNNKRIKLLEQMAENLYKHSFSSEKVEGCSEQRKLKEVISIIRGVSYSSEEIECEDGNALINLKNIQGFGGFRADGTKRYSGKYKKAQVVKTGDLVMGVTDMTQDRRTVGAVALLPILKETSVISADLIKIESDIDNIFLYSMFRFGKVSSYIAQFANGANVLHLRPQSIESIKVYIPPKDMIDRFVSVVKPMVEEINQLNESNENLIKQRDLLLPRLMSGKLEV